MCLRSADTYRGVGGGGFVLRLPLEEEPPRAAGSLRPLLRLREVRGGALRGGRGEGAGAEVPDLQVGVRPLHQGVQLRMNDCVQHNSGCL